jgi:catechol 2,3-dioxygenase-like lactoylglutathione lyase family enzyme
MAPGLRSVGILDCQAGAIDGARVHNAEPATPAAASSHQLGATAIDHVVLMTSDLDRTCAAVTNAIGVPLRRVREAGPVRQGFFRLGQVILEVVESAQHQSSAAEWWGLVINVTDLAAACERLGNIVGPARNAVQPGRMIASVRDEAGLGLPLALMSV